MWVGGVKVSEKGEAVFTGTRKKDRKMGEYERRVRLTKKTPGKKGTPSKKRKHGIKRHW